MTFFLRSKIQGQQKKVAKTFATLIKQADKYDELTLEYQNENSFMQPNQQRAPSIMISIFQGMMAKMGIVPQQTAQQQIQEPQQIVAQPVVSQQKELTQQEVSHNAWSEERKKAFAEKMRKAREASKKIKVEEIEP
jgi:hypothetical protein